MESPELTLTQELAGEAPVLWRDAPGDPRSLRSSAVVPSGAGRERQQPLGGAHHQPDPRARKRFRPNMANAGLRITPDKGPGSWLASHPKKGSGQKPPPVPEQRRTPGHPSNADAANQNIMELLAQVHEDNTGQVIPSAAMLPPPPLLVQGTKRKHGDAGCMPRAANRTHAAPRVVARGAIGPNIAECAPIPAPADDDDEFAIDADEMAFLQLCSQAIDNKALAQPQQTKASTRILARNGGGASDGEQRQQNPVQSLTRIPCTIAAQQKDATRSTQAAAARADSAAAERMKRAKQQQAKWRESQPRTSTAAKANASSSMPPIVKAITLQQHQHQHQHQHQQQQQLLQQQQQQQQPLQQQQQQQPLRPPLAIAAQRTPFHKPSQADKGFSPFDDDDDDFWTEAGKVADMAEALLPQSSSERTLLSQFLFSRFLVVGINDAPGQFEKSVRVQRSVRSAQSGDDDASREAVATCTMSEMNLVLRDDWCDSNIEPGDTVHIVWHQQGQACAAPAPSATDIVVDNNRNALVLEPDLLLSPTQINNARECLRKAVLGEKFPDSSINVPCLLGTLKHDLFEHALLHSDYTRSALGQAACSLLGDARTVERMHACQYSETDAMRELQGTIYSIMHFGRRFCQQASSGATISSQIVDGLQPRAAKMSLRISRVRATEEMMWVPTWGLKGAIDATLEASVGNTAFGGQRHTQIVPLELKSGKKTGAYLQHRAQVILYSLMLRARYGSGQHEDWPGILLYLGGSNAKKGGSQISQKEDQMIVERVDAGHADTRSLLIRRNHLAAAIATALLPPRSGKHTSTVIKQPPSVGKMPTLCGLEFECKHCFQLPSCMVYHRAVERGTGETSLVPLLFQEHTQHLAEVDLQYFRHWDRLITLECADDELTQRAIWNTPADSREVAGLCLCKLVLNHMNVNMPPPGGGRNSPEVLVRFVRAPPSVQRCSGPHLMAETFSDTKFDVNDHVVLSECNAGSAGRVVEPLQYNMARGAIVELNATNVVVKFRLSPAHSKQIFSQDRLWRLDKDVFRTTANVMRANLMRLMTGASHKTADGSAGIAVSHSAKLRSLVVSVMSPRFLSCAGQDLIVAPPCLPGRSQPVLAPNATWLQARLEKALVDARAGQGANSLQRVASLTRLRKAYTALNEDQRQAAAMAVFAKDYALIVGMPGTGKTSTIAFVARLMVALGKRVLISAYTNSAVDNLLLKILEGEGAMQATGRDAPCFPLIRLGQPSQASHQMRPYTTQAICEAAATAGGKQPGGVGAALRTSIRAARVVGVTSVTAARHPLLQTLRFDVSIVDEAGQLAEPSCLGALHASDAFVLVGDHNQLPPLVRNKQAKDEGMGTSLFQRLVSRHRHAVAPLRHQYRMNEEIMEISNRLVYNMQLQCGNQDIARQRLRMPVPPQLANLDRKASEPAWLEDVLAPSAPVLFLDTDQMLPASDQSTTKGGNSEASTAARVNAPAHGAGTTNRAEALIVATCVRGLVQCGVSLSTIGVITPYRAQLKVLNENMRDLLPDLEMHTVDRFQGRDKACIVMSMVRSKKKQSVGLLADWQRLNVAMTRAKSKLIIVGSSSTMRGNPKCEALTNLMERRGWLYQLPLNAHKAYPTLVAKSISERSSSRAPARGAASGSQPLRCTPTPPMVLSLRENRLPPSKCQWSTNNYW